MNDLYAVNVINPYMSKMSYAKSLKQVISAS